MYIYIYIYIEDRELPRNRSGTYVRENKKAFVECLRKQRYIVALELCTMY